MKVASNKRMRLGLGKTVKIIIFSRVGPRFRRCLYDGPLGDIDGDFF